MSVSFRGAEKTLLDGVAIDRNVVVNINVIREIQSHNPSLLFFVLSLYVLLLFIPFFSKELTDGRITSTPILHFRYGFQSSSS